MQGRNGLRKGDKKPWEVVCGGEPGSSLLSDILYPSTSGTRLEGCGSNMLRLFPFL